jgi:alkanesulfonate monooxygenase SsuD/methylene tetrahydromethanopterin reductase-like flavin-dependent oxidoreductase (luciferase family)
MTIIIGAIARSQQSPESIREIALAAEASGLDELWLWEDSFSSGAISMSAAVLGMTERLRVGIGVMPIPFRNVALAAMEVATIERVFPGRILPGFGHGVQEWMGQAGVRAPSFLTLAREYIAALRALLAGDEVTVSGDYVRLDRVKLDWPPEVAPQLHMAGVGPKSLAVSGEIGDGTVLVSDTELRDFPRIRSIVEAARADSGRIGVHELTVFVTARTGDPAATIAAAEAWAEAGAHRVVFEPTEDEPDPVGFVRFIATEVRGRAG